MACLIKLPTRAGKGVLSFTTQEEKVLRADHLLIESLRRLKSKYLVCLHYNWHNHDCKPDDLFDVHLAGEEDLVVTNGRPVERIPLDACNFTKRVFDRSAGEKTWDILFVARAVNFKGIPDFLKAIRELYDAGRMLRVLFICPMPPYRRSDRSTTLYDLREVYERGFTSAEQDLFNLVILRDRYPFFFDRQTLAHFYKSSRIFVHTAPDERRCRVAAYAWCCGMPLVGKASVAAILPRRLRCEPNFFEVAEDGSYAAQILRALESAGSVELLPLQHELSEKFTIRSLEDRLREVFLRRGEHFEGPILAENLDIRMGRHHGFGDGTNSVDMSLEEFMDKASALTGEANSGLPAQPDPEKYIVGEKKVPPAFVDRSFAFQKVEALKLRIFRAVRRALGRG
jgi:glycosyltransferase involved in cell wall biosynthesis